MTDAKLGSTVVLRMPPHLTEQYNAQDPASPIEIGDERPAIVVGLTEHDDGNDGTFTTADLVIFHRSGQTTFTAGAPLDVLRGVEEEWDDERESSDDASNPAGGDSDGQTGRTMPPAGGTPQDGPANTSSRARRTS